MPMTERQLDRVIKKLQHVRQHVSNPKADEIITAAITKVLRENSVICITLTKLEKIKHGKN